MELLNVQNNIDTREMLSSRVYPTDFFSRCIYCDKDVENDYYDYKGEWYQPYRCICEMAISELEAKEDLLNKLAQLNKFVNIEFINSKTKEYEISEVVRKYEDNEE